MSEIINKVVDDMVTKAKNIKADVKSTSAPKAETITPKTEIKMDSSEDMFDLIVIGAGPGGYHAALRAAQWGVKIAIIEKQYLGGTCSNWGCIPTKALYSSAKLLEDIKEKAEEFGITAENLKADFGKAVARKNKVVEDLRAGIKGLLDVRKISIYQGAGKIENGNKNEGFTVSVNIDGGKIFIKGKRVIIATGSTPLLIPAFNIDHKKIITSDDILSAQFNTLPKSMIIIGAGVIGCEFAFIMKSFGVEVTMLEFLPSMLATEEPRVVKVLKQRCVDCGIGLHTSQNVLKIEATETGVIATTCSATVPRDNIDAAEKFTHEAELCLVSIGRGKIVKDIVSDSLELALERNAIVVDSETMETSIPGIYAIGDVNNTGLMLAHVASYQGDIAVSQILSNLGVPDVHVRKASIKDAVPYTIFTNPEIGSVGMRQKAAKDWAKENGTKVLVGQFYYNSLGKAKCMGEEEGFLMVLADAKTDLILGATCVGHEAPELISEISIAMQNGITTKDLGHSIHSHPTISEMVLEAVEDVRGMAIHKAGRRI